ADARRRSPSRGSRPARPRLPGSAGGPRPPGRGPIRARANRRRASPSAYIRPVKATLLLADYARVSGGKLDVIGGGWSIMNAQGPFGFYVAVLFQIPWDQTNTKHTFRFDLIDADGQSIPTTGGEDTVHA